MWAQGSVYAGRLPQEVFKSRHDRKCVIKWTDQQDQSFVEQKTEG